MPGKTPARDPKEPKGRSHIIEAAKTPLGFFVVAILVVEVFLGVIVGLSDDSSRQIALIGAISLFALLIFIVAFFAYQRPEALAGTRPSLQIQDETARRSEIVEVGNNNSVSISKRSFRVGYFSSPYAEEMWGSEKDEIVVQAIRRLAGPKHLHIARRVDASFLRQKLISTQLDLVHLEAPVIGDAIQFKLGDELSGQALASLLSLSKTKIVILASCNSFALAAHLPKEMTVVAASQTVHTEPYYIWAKTFYELLDKGQSVFDAHNAAQKIAHSNLNISKSIDYNLTP